MAKHHKRSDNPAQPQPKESTDIKQETKQQAKTPEEREQDGKNRRAARLREENDRRNRVKAEGDDALEHQKAFGFRDALHAWYTEVRLENVKEEQQKKEAKPVINKALQLRNHLVERLKLLKTDLLVDKNTDVTIPGQVRPLSLSTPAVSDTCTILLTNKKHLDEVLLRLALIKWKANPKNKQHSAVPSEGSEELVNMALDAIEDVCFLWKVYKNRDRLDKKRVFPIKPDFMVMREVLERGFTFQYLLEYYKPKPPVNVSNSLEHHHLTSGLLSLRKQRIYNMRHALLDSRHRTASGW